MPTPISEFQRLRELISNGSHASIILYTKRPLADPLLDAYTYLDGKPASIVLQKTPKISYRDLILVLLHEYAHVLDYEAKKHSKRWKLTGKYDYDCKTLCKVKEWPMYVKRAFLQREYIAQKKVQTLLKHFRIKFDNNNYTEEELGRELIMDILNNKYELKYRKKTPRKLKKQWEENLKNDHTRFTKDYLTDWEKFG